MIEGWIDLEIGDIVHVEGCNGELIVTGCNLYDERIGFFEHQGIENPVICQWVDDEGLHHEDWFRPDAVTLVRRKSGYPAKSGFVAAWSYHQVTAAARAEILRLTEKSRGKMDEDHQSYWDAAQGVLGLWSQITGEAGTPPDAQMLQALIEAMPR